VERTTNVPFDLIVAAREDIQLFKPVHLAALHNMRSRDHSGEPCDVLYPRCYSWNGLSMRLKVFPRKFGTDYLGGRLEFYRQSATNGTRYAHTEAFELAQAKWQGARVCELMPSELSAIPGRYLGNGSLCFPARETVDNCPHRQRRGCRKVTCYPMEAEEFVESHVCAGDMYLGPRVDAKGHRISPGQTDSGRSLANFSRSS